MPVTVVVELTLAPKDASNTVTQLAHTLSDTRDFDGCLGIQLLVDQGDESHVLLLEQWESREHQERYMEWRASSGASSIGPDAFVAAPRIAFFDSRAP